ncbi:MAG: hypothetical protein A2X56_11350 [Nitrospirae bacterium GWC2_57_13]|nr:MAG: hypothetical protein A2X56_11350 [Nitrospirae bacterium GWC2_57_13]
MKKFIIAFTLSASILPGCGSDFTPVAPDSGRRAHTAVVVSVSGSDKMYVFGGLSNGIFVNELWEYGIASDVWTQKSPVLPGPGARTYSAAVADGPGNMYVLGGYDGTNRTTPVFYNDIWKYEPNAGEGTWAEVTPTNMPRLAGHSAVMDGAAIYIFGGYDGVGADYVDDLWHCDLVSGNCSIITPVTSGPLKRAFHSAAIVGSDIYIYGGYGLNTSSTISNLDELWKYDIALNSWTSIPLAPAVPDGPTPAARSKHTAVIATVDSIAQMIVFGGVGSTSNKIWLYDINAKTWTENADEIITAPASRASHSAVIDTINNKMYIYGGYTASGATSSLNDLWAFLPVDTPPDIWTLLTSPPKQ